MRLHAKLLGNNPFCIFPIWLVYCTFKRTERINTLYEQVWIQSNTENPGLWGLCYSVWDCRDAVCQLLHIPTTRTAETGLQVPKVPYRTGGWTCLSCTVLQDEHLYPPCANLTIWYNFTSPMPPLTTNHKNYGQWQKENHKQTKQRKMPGFDKCLLSVLSQFKAITKCN